MKTFLTRVLSSIIAVLIISGIVYFFHTNGLRFFIFLVVVIGTRELIGILFHPEESLTIKGLFYFMMILLFILSTRFMEFSGMIFSCVSILFFATSLVLRNKFEDLNSLSLFQAKSILGFLYLGLLPAFACKLLEFRNGLVWFIALLVIVLSGDTLAYITGRLWGNKKIMPQISPKKTIVGSLGGFFGSLLATGFLTLALPHIPTIAFMTLGAVIGVIAQFGDFFESTLKRVAHVKDSGSIMPGHGGVLDRIDGILFASPFVYLVASFYDSYSLIHS